MSTISASTTTTTAYSVTADTTGTLVLQTGATPTTAVTVGTDQSVTFAQAANLPNTFGFKNRIINGAMVIDQRNAGASVTPTVGTYTLDRWSAFLTAASKFSVQQNAGSVTPPAGFKNYLGVTSTSAYSVAAGDYLGISQPIEGLNFYDFGWGAAGAQSATLSFWVRSSLTGTFGGNFRNNGGDRNYPFTYTISSANTWEQKTVTVPGDTSGTWLTTNGTAVTVLFGLGVGSTYSGPAGAWTSNNYILASGAVSIVGTNGATFYITGVQLEKGSTATSFDYRPYGTELALCQRYYYKSAGERLFFSGSPTSGQTYYSFCTLTVTMRATPTITLTSTNGLAFAGTSGTAGSITVDGFYESRVATATVTSGFFGSSVIASAEL